MHFPPMVQSKAHLLFTLVVIVAAAPYAGFARTEERLLWTQTSSEGSTALSYGALDREKTPLFLLSCFTEMEIAVLDIFGAIEGTAPGQKLTVELSSGGAQL